MCFFTCFFFLGGLWTIFMIILTHNLFAEAHNSCLTFGHSFWHFVVDDFVVRRRRRSHADQWIKTNKFSSNFQVEIQTEINLFSNLFPSKFQYKCHHQPPKNISAVKKRIWKNVKDIITRYGFFKKSLSFLGRHFGCRPLDPTLDIWSNFVKHFTSLQCCKSSQGLPRVTKGYQKLPKVNR